MRGMDTQERTEIHRLAVTKYCFRTAGGPQDKRARRLVIEQCLASGHVDTFALAKQGVPYDRATRVMGELAHVLRDYGP